MQSRMRVTLGPALVKAMSQEPGGKYLGPQRQDQSQSVNSITSPVSADDSAIHNITMSAAVETCLATV